MFKNISVPHTIVKWNSNKMMTYLFKIVIKEKKENTKNNLSRQKMINSKNISRYFEI